MNILLGVFSSGFEETKHRLGLKAYSYAWPKLDVNPYSSYANGLI